MAEEIEARVEGLLKRVARLERQAAVDREETTQRLAVLAPAVALAVLTAVPWVELGRSNEHYTLWGQAPEDVSALALLAALLLLSCGGLYFATASEVTRAPAVAVAVLGGLAAVATLWMRSALGEEYTDGYADEHVEWSPATWLALVCVAGIVAGSLGRWKVTKYWDGYRRA